MKGAKSKTERRRHSRFPIGLPVKVTLAGAADPITVELLDISLKGGRFHAFGDEVRVGQRAAFAFVVPDQGRCLAEGSVARIKRGGEFVVTLDETNDAFRAFVRQLAEPDPSR